MDRPVPISAVLRDYAPATRPPSRTGPGPYSTCLVATVHLAAIAAAIVVFPRKPPVAPAELSVPLVLQPPSLSSPPTVPETLAVTTLPTPAITEADPIAAIRPLRLAGMPRARPLLPAAHRTFPAPVATPPQAAITRTPARPASPQAAPSPPAALSASALAAWEAQVHLAIQNALVYPNAARLMHREGRTRIRFDYDHGAVVDASVVATSNLAAFDHAALEAVARAAIPAPPAEMSGQNRTLLLWVNFTLSSED